MSDFKTNDGRVDSGVSSEASPIEAGTPTTGFDDGPKGEQGMKGPGPGIGANSKRLH